MLRCFGLEETSITFSGDKTMLWLCGRLPKLSRSEAISYLIGDACFRAEISRTLSLRRSVLSVYLFINLFIFCIDSEILVSITDFPADLPFPSLATSDFTSWIRFMQSPARRVHVSSAFYAISLILSRSLRSITSALASLIYFTYLFKSLSSFLTDSRS